MRRFLVGVLLLTGCPEEPLLIDYDTTCAVDEDCVLVVDQGYCGNCESWGALNAEGAEAFEADQVRYGRRVQCRASILIGCMPSEAPDITCEAGTCITVAD